MQAITCLQYGGPEVMRLGEIPDPTIGESDVLIRVHASSVNAMDWRTTRADPWIARLAIGLMRPTKMPVVGSDIAGIVEAVGSAVTRFSVADEVFGNIWFTGYGGFSEKARATEEQIAHKPTNLSFEEAAALPLAALTALKGLRDGGGVKAGDHVLITGASGGVGMFAVQVAKAMGATVTAATRTSKLDFVRGLGADRVIDRTRQDPVEVGPYDVVFDAAAFRPIGDYRRGMAPDGRYVMVGGRNKTMLTAGLLGPVLFRRGQKARVLSFRPNHEDLDTLRQMAEDGQLRPVIERSTDLAGVPEAIDQLYRGEAEGKIVVRIASSATRERPLAHSIHEAGDDNMNIAIEAANLTKRLERSAA